MAGKCKICHCDQREKIENRLYRGDTPVLISEWLKTIGISISHTSIRRHQQNHLEKKRFDFVSTLDTNTQATTNDDTPFINAIGAIERIQTELENIDVFTSVVEARKFTQLNLEKILQKQLVIVSELQDLYIKGKTPYPDAQIRGLKTILDMANTLPTYKRETMLRDIKAENDKRINNVDCVDSEPSDFREELIKRILEENENSKIRHD